MNVETLIREANPVRASDIEPGDSPGPRRALEQILREPAKRRRPSARTIGLAAVAAAAAGAAAIVMIATLPGPATQLTQPPPGLAAAFRHLSLLAASQPASAPLGPGQFQYTSSTSGAEGCSFTAGGSISIAEGTATYGTYGSGSGPSGDNFCFTYRSSREIWIGFDGSGRLRERAFDLRFRTAHDREAWIKAGRPSLGLGSSDDKLGPLQLTDGPRNLLTLPTDPQKLAALIFARKIEGGPPGPAEDFVQVGDLLRETDAPPALRAALFQIAARIPGARLLAPGDGIPRGQVGVAYIDHLPKTGLLSKTELIFRRTTTALAAERTVLTDPATHKVTVPDWTTYIATGVVDSTTQTIPPSGS